MGRSAPAPEGQERLTVSLPVDLKREAKATAARAGESLTALIQRAIERELARMEKGRQ